MELEWEKPPRQGQFGDCWLISVLHAVWRSEPWRLRKMICALPCGRYQVSLAHETVWIWAAFPPNAGQPRWCGLIEKAVALFCGGYHKINGNTIYFACQLLFKKFRLRMNRGNPLAIVDARFGHHAIAVHQTVDLEIL